MPHLQSRGEAEAYCALLNSSGVSREGGGELIKGLDANKHQLSLSGGLILLRDCFLQ